MKAENGITKQNLAELAPWLPFIGLFLVLYVAIKGYNPFPTLFSYIGSMIWQIISTLAIIFFVVYLIVR